MSLHLKLWRLELYLVLGRVYHLSNDAIQTTCLRGAWNGRKVFTLGPSPIPYEQFVGRNPWFKAN